MTITDDPNDPRIKRGPDTEPAGMGDVYLVLSEKERAKGFVRPYRDRYVHVVCSRGGEAITTMGTAIAETYARNPQFYGGTYCAHCQMHRPLSEFEWLDGSQVGS